MNSFSGYSPAPARQATPEQNHSSTTSVGDERGYNRVKTTTAGKFFQVFKKSNFKT